VDHAVVVGICIAFLVHEFRKLYESVKNEDRKIVFDQMMEMDMEGDDFDKIFIISEQRKIINKLKIKNNFNKKVAKHYKELYLWRENC
jgi:hypothetical protein